MDTSSSSGSFGRDTDRGMVYRIAIFGPSVTFACAQCSADGLRWQRRWYGSHGDGIYAPAEPRSLYSVTIASGSRRCGTVICWLYSEADVVTQVVSHGRLWDGTVSRPYDLHATILRPPKAFRCGLSEWNHSLLLASRHSTSIVRYRRFISLRSRSWKGFFHLAQSPYLALNERSSGSIQSAHLRLPLGYLNRSIQLQKIQCHL